MSPHFSLEALADYSDVEFLSILALRRLPHDWEVWRDGPLLTARLLIRSSGEFVSEHPRFSALINPYLDLVIPTDAALVDRAFRVVVERAASAEELEHWTKEKTVSLAALSASLFYSRDGLVADGLLAPQHAGSADDDLRREQMNSSHVQHDLHAMAVNRRQTNDPRQKSKIGSLAKGTLRIATNLWRLPAPEIARIISAIGSRFPGVSVSLTDVTTADVVSGYAGEFDIFLTNNNFLYENLDEQLAAIAAMKAVSVCWFWDSHHQFDFVHRVVQVFDLMFPAHSNGSLALHSGRTVVGPVIPCCVFQWDTAQAEDFFGQAECLARNDRLYGRFNSHPGRTALRDAFLRAAGAALGDNAIEVTHYGENKWFWQPPLDRFMELAQHKVVICNPIFNDIPARLFDTLLAGAIPLIPYGLPDGGISFSDAAQLALPILQYLPDDLNSLAIAHRRAVRDYDRGGQAGAWSRHQTALDGHMLHHRVARILSETMLCGEMCAA